MQQQSPILKTLDVRIAEALEKTGALKPEFMNLTNSNSAEDSMLNKKGWIDEVHQELITLLKSPETIVANEFPNQALEMWCEKLFAKAFEGDPRMSESKQALLLCATKNKPIDSELFPDSNEQNKRHLISQLLSVLSIEHGPVLKDFDAKCTNDQNFAIYLANKNSLQAFILDKLALSLEYAGHVADLKEVAINDSPTTNRALINLLTKVIHDSGYSGNDANIAKQIAAEEHRLYLTSNVQQFLAQKAEKYQGSKDVALEMVGQLVKREFEKAIKVVREEHPELISSQPLLFDKDLKKVMGFLYSCTYQNAKIANQNLLQDVENNIPEQVKLAARYFYQEAGF
jgi:hypothetical protein